MKQGTILEAARRDNSDLVKGGLALLVLCGLVLGFNWKYVYNWFAGPFRFDAALAASPGAREWVRVEGKLAPTGVVQTTTLRLLKGLAETKSVSAQYMAMLVNDRVLLVKVPPEFSGQVVEGTLTALPETVRASLPSGANPYPWLVDAHEAYRWSFNLFVMIVGPLSPLCLLFFLYALWRGGQVERHPALAALKPLGPLAQTVQKIENEMRLGGEKARVGPLWITASWIVTLSPSLLILRSADLIAFGHQKSVDKKGVVSNQLRFWLRGRLISEDLEVTPAEAVSALTALQSRWPQFAVDDTAVFQRRWSQDKAGCTTEADSRRGSGKTQA